jgi:hypothetical protein
LYEWVRKRVARDSETENIVDLYPVHTQSGAWQRAEELNIPVHCVPLEMTNVLQPQDGRVFGLLKSAARRDYRMLVAANSRKNVTEIDAVQMLRRAGDQPGASIITAPWIMCEDPPNEDARDEVDDSEARNEKEES